MTVRETSEPPVDELVEQAEQRHAASVGLQERIASVTGTATDPDGLVVATASASGRLLRLRLHPAALALGGAALGRTVVDTTRRAGVIARQRCLNQLALVLGDDLTTHLEDVMGVAPARTDGWDTVRSEKHRGGY
jgi:hypothetical protein